jgi:hypothetical protein
MTTNLMLTAVAVSCVRCGSTTETVKRDRELLGTVVCCEPRPRPVTCYFCDDTAKDPYSRGRHPFCSRACAVAYAE